MSEEKRCKHYCATIEGHKCCYECDKNQDCDDYDISVCGQCHIYKNNNYKSITDRHGRITRVGKVKENNPEPAISIDKVRCHIYCEDMNNKYVCCYQCEKKDKCSSINRCNNKCYNYLMAEKKIDEICNTCSKKDNKCKDQYQYNCKVDNYCYYVKSSKENYCSTCKKRYECADMHEYECKANNYCYYAKEKQENNKTENITNVAIKDNKELIPQEMINQLKDCANKTFNNIKRQKLLEIECILRDCTIDELIDELVSDKTKAIYDNVVDK